LTQDLFFFILFNGGAVYSPD